MALLPNEHFVNYLKNYGPWQASSNQQAENTYLTKSSNKGVEPFHFVIKKQQDYCTQLKKLIEQQQSQLIFISGQAGDGKTYFLRRIFNDPDLLAQKEGIWEQYQQEKVFSVEHPNAQITFTIVKDFSEIDPDNKDLLDLLFKNIQSITSHNTLKCQIVLIAGNNGKILEHFSARAKYDITLDHNIVTTLEQFMLLAQHAEKLDQYAITCFDITKFMDKELISLIFKQIIDRPDWNKCQTCTHAANCPILRNRNMLKENTIFLKRLEQIFELLIDNGTHFTIRNIILLVANTILGCKNKQKSSRFYSCKRIANAFAKNKWKDNDASPYDNLLGSNFLVRNKNNADTPIFRQLEPVAIGENTSKLIDGFLLFGQDDHFLNLSKQYQTLFSAFEQCFGYSTKLHELVDNIQDDERLLNDDDSTLNSELQQLHNLLLSLRRMLFFTMNDNSKELFNPFLLTSYHYAKQYFALKHALSCHKNADADTVKLLIVGLNRVFTSLMVLNKDCPLVISTNNMLNPTAFCVVYDKDQYQLSYHSGDAPLITRIKLVDGSLVREEGQLYLAYYGAIDLDINIQRTKLEQQLRDLIKSNANDFTKLQDITAQIDKLDAAHENNQGKLVTYLKITPKIFDYLMSLAHGVMPISFTDECFQEINAFKSALENYISRNQHLSDKQELYSLKNQLQTIRFYSLDVKGKICE